MIYKKINRVFNRNIRFSKKRYTKNIFKINLQKNAT